MAPAMRRFVYVLLPTAFFLLRNLRVLLSQQPVSNPVLEETVVTATIWMVNHGIIGSPNSTIIVTGSCSCELVSIDCLDAIACLPTTAETGLKRIQEGIIKRRAVQRNAIYWGAHIEDEYSWAPMGKAMQSISIKLWREWMITNHLPLALVSRNETFVNETWYPYCVRRGLKGRACFFSGFGDEEPFGDLEREALARHGRGTAIERAAARQELRLLREFPYDASPYSYLLHFSHVSRIALNMRSFLMDIYDKRVRTIPGKGANSKNVLRVALHVRRGDACSHELDGYSQKASPLYSDAQFSGTRLCYDTSVYMTALQRVRSIAAGRHIVVYIATDHMTSLLDEIQKTHRTLYDAVTWKFVDYSRNLFNYSSNLMFETRFIEWAPNAAELGETAVVDIWHLSHGQIFIGHLGSRFGKLSWWQATSRHNSFVPFYSVDGHSVCCDIDEACGSMSLAIVSMENCLTFDREHSNFRVDAATYWTKGSTVRFQAALQEAEHRLARMQNLSLTPSQ